MTNKQPVVLSIGGPTAVGKTDMAIALAQHWHAEIISFDSRQFYRELQIGAAPPGPAQLAQAPHHFVGNRSVQEPWNAGDFEKAALQKLEALFQKHALVILVGGSGLYLKALAEGFDPLPPVSEALRQKWRAAFQQQGLPYLQEQLQKMDPHYYQLVDRKNPQRLLRALEVTESSGQPYSSLRRGAAVQRPFKLLQVGLSLPRPLLYQRIDERARQMIAQGLVAEARALQPLKHLNALQTVGYRELFAHFDGQLSLDEALAEIQKNTRRFAKRQLTWFRKQTALEWFEPNEREALISWTSNQLKNQAL